MHIPVMPMGFMECILNHNKEQKKDRLEEIF